MNQLYKFKKLEVLYIWVYRDEIEIFNSQSFQFLLENILTELPELKSFGEVRWEFDEVKILLSHTPLRYIRLFSN